MNKLTIEGGVMMMGSAVRVAAVAFTAAAFSAATFAQDTTGAGQRADADRDRIVTVTGCLMAERDVPGRDDNLFQRWGLMDRDYVLTGARAQHGTQSSQQTGQADQAGRTTAGTTGTADHGAQHHRVHADTMLKVDGKDADDLRQYANQRVEIRGRLNDQNWFERAWRGDRDQTGTTATGPAPGTAGTGTTGTGTTGTGTTGTDADRTGVGTTGTGTTSRTTDTGDRLASIDVESIRAVGPCQQ